MTIEAPTVRLAPIDEVAAAARQCALLRSVRRVAEWVGAERKITKSGRLTLADARKAVQQLMLPGDQGPGRSPARRAADFEELDDLWHLALGAELLDEHASVVRPGPALKALEHGGDEEVTQVWCDLLGVRLDQIMWSEDLSDALVPVLMSLYVADVPLPKRDLGRAAVSVALDLDPDEVDAVPLARAMLNGATQLVEEFTAELATLDAVVDADGLVMTPLGRFGLHQWLETVGIAAPAVADPAEATAAEIVQLGYTLGGDELESIFDAWVAARGPEQAAHDLIEYAASVPDQESRVAAASMAGSLGPPAEPAHRAALAFDVLRPHARAWLYTRGLDATEPTSAEFQWLFVEALAPMVHSDEIVDALKDAPEHLELVRGLWQCTHPQTADVLDALAARHPDPEIARAARKALLKSRGGGVVVEPRRTRKAGAKPKSAKARAKARTAAARADFEASACQLKITLADVKPPIWRRVTVLATITLPGLHAVVQTAMGWADTHLHEFEVDGRRYGGPDPDWASDVRPEAGVRLLDLVREGGRVSYTYDFGDDWRHTITVEKVLPGDVGTDVPSCLAGRRGCPPEDTGGPWVYDEFLAAYRDPKHPEHETMREWAGPYFDPEHFNPDETTQALRHLLA